jgi:hypothetical protein
MTDLNRVKKLAGILNEDYQYDMTDKGDMHDALGDVQNSMDDAVKNIQKAAGLARQVYDAVEDTLYTDESVEEADDEDEDDDLFKDDEFTAMDQEDDDEVNKHFKRMRELAGIEERKVNFDPDDMYDQGTVRKNALEALMDMFNTAKEYEGEVSDDQIHLLGTIIQDFDLAGIETEKYSEVENLFRSASANGNVSSLNTIKKAYQQIKQMSPEDVK